jgi:hypothetical protein
MDERHVGGRRLGRQLIAAFSNLKVFFSFDLDFFNIFSVPIILHRHHRLIEFSTSIRVVNPYNNLKPFWGKVKIVRK